MIQYTQAEVNTLREAVFTWLTLMANDEPGDLSEAIDITLSAGEILRITKAEMSEILERG